MSNEEKGLGKWEAPQDPVEVALEPGAPREPRVEPQVLAPGQSRCPGCNRNLEAARMEFSNGALMCKTCIQNQRERPIQPASDQVSAGGVVVSAIGGAVGAVAGGGIWAAIAIATDLEVGYVAVLVGFLAGIGVRWGAGGRGGQGEQLLAAVLAVAGMLAAKYFVFAYVVIQFARERGIDVGFVDHALWSRFPAMLAETVGPFDAVFAFLAIAAALRAAKPR